MTVPSCRRTCDYAAADGHRRSNALSHRIARSAEIANCGNSPPEHRSKRASVHAVATIGPARTRCTRRDRLRLAAPSPVGGSKAVTVAERRHPPDLRRTSWSTPRLLQDGAAATTNEFLA